MGAGAGAVGGGGLLRPLLVAAGQQPHHVLCAARGNL